ncbi:hypothetical protein [Enterovibrio coralii]|uniref:Uncharacterized protein n=1 Tax=Enterovibrio coralii TaxID=294935 RepID=A0A135IAH3_9GAMM|nr:hypothetical protein [Enterovibrio coralii]KXF82450.1 hypothetical protein ATN88_10090 [Enterovibrio coralii]
MTTHDFPFFAGQLTNKTFGSSLVLSPVPVYTNLPPLDTHDILVNKTDSYIEMGGAGGMIFQTQQMWVIFLMSLGIPIWLLWSDGGIMGFINAFYREQKIDGVWVDILDPMQVFGGIGLFFIPMLAGCSFYSKSIATLGKRLPKLFLYVSTVSVGKLCFPAGTKRKNALSTAFFLGKQPVPWSARAVP